MSGFLALLVDGLVRGAAVLAFALVADALARRLRTSAGARYAMWVAAFAAVAATPLLGALLPPIEVEWPLAAPAAPAALFDAAGSSPPRPAVATGSAPRIDVARVAAATWLAGAALLALLFASRRAALAAAARRAASLDSPDWRELFAAAARDSGVRRPVRLLASDDVAVPIALARAIVLPAAATRAWAPDRRRAILLHELAHVRRGDALVQAAATLVVAAHWPNPLAWLALARLVRERERSCDDAAVIASGGRPSAYARHLLAVAGGATPLLAAPAMASSGGRSEIAVRVRALLEPGVERRAPRRFAVAGLVAGALVLAAPIGVLRARPADAAIAALVSALGDETPVDPAALGRAPGGPLYGSLPESTAGKEAARALVARGRAAVDPLLEALSAAGAREAAREKAAWALGRIGDRRAAAALAAAASGDPSARVRRIAAWALGEMSAAAGRSALEGALATDDSADVRAAAAHALGDVGSRGSTDALVAALGDASPAVRERAAHALGDLADPRAARALESAARADGDAGVRDMATWALREIGDRP